jgi:hypothetical protein
VPTLSSRARRKAGICIAAGLASLAVTMTLVALTVPASQASPATYSIWPSNLVPGTAAEHDKTSVELGTVFSTSTPGTVSAIRFYKSPANRGPHTGKLWSQTGVILASVTFASETASGWQVAQLSSPVSISSGAQYTVSYRAQHGRYSNDQHVFSYGRQVKSGVLTASSGVYSYNTGKPSLTWNGAAYYVDVVFSPSTSGITPTSTTTVPTPTATVTSPSTPTPSPTPPEPPATSATSSSPSSSIPPAPSGQLSLTAVDGGLNYYSRWSKNRVPASLDFFPIGVWSEQADNVSRVKGYGINTYVTTYGDPAKVTAAGLYNLDPLEDEADMRFGPGYDEYHPDVAWPNSCTNSSGNQTTGNAQCGYTAMQQAQSRVATGEMRYANYGKGVGFWESDSEAAKFVNDYQDVVSIDLYWGTDPDLCVASQGGVILGTGTTVSSAQCHKPSNYGVSVDRVRSLVSPAGSKPVWNFVEVGNPGEFYTQMPVAKIKPAVWASLIHGARGIVYFNHSFGGSCQSQHVMDTCDPAIAQAVTAINSQITSLAPVLNSPTVNGVEKTGSIDQLTKWDGANFYVFTGSTLATGSTMGSVTVPGGPNGTAEVIGEDRTVQVINGTITDTWTDANTVHLYKIK